MHEAAIDCNQWVDRYGNAMFRYTLLRVRDETHDEEVVQNTFLAALQSKHSIAGLSSEKTWLFGILKHKILDHFREVKKNRTYELQLDVDQDPCDQDFDGKGHWQTLPVRWEFNPEKSAENQQLSQILLKCLKTLSEKFQDLFVLREIEGLSSKEICRELDITPNNLWVMLHRTRNQMKKCMEVHWLEKNPSV